MIPLRLLYTPFPLVMPGVDLGLALVMLRYQERIYRHHAAVCRAAFCSGEQHTVANIRSWIALDCATILRQHIISTSLQRMN